MVGVKRSAGCSLCVKRRVKCDEKRPGCGNCSKYGVPCPGFQRPLKFLGAKHGQSPGPHHIHASATPRPWNEAAAGGLDGSARDPAVDAATNSSPNRPRSRASPVNILPSHLRPSRDYELAPLAQSLWHADNAEDFFHFNAWFSSIADRLGSKVTLDTAVCAFALQVQGTTHGDELLCARARTVYVKALSSLQQALYHRLEWKSSETLCSAMLLCLYESFAGTSSSVSWMKHASGVGRLMESRGAEAHMNLWDAAMVEAFRGFLITYSLFTLQDCFLTREEWREVLRLRDKGPVGDAIETFWLYFSQCPAIVRQAHRLRAKRLNNEPIDRTEIIDVSQQAETLHIRFLHWYRTIIGFLPLPEETPSQGPNALCPTTYKFPSVWIGSLFIGCWTSLLILQAILGECNFREEFAESNQELLEKVLKSVDYTAQGMMGPYRVGYALRIAVEFADPPTRKRIIDFLGRISSSFAAITPRNSARIFPLLAVGYPDRSALK